MTRLWLLDTNVVVDWCLWELAEDTRRPGIAKHAATRLRCMKTKPAVESFESHLSKSRGVALAQPTLLEIGARLQDLLRHPHRGTEDRLNEPILECGLRFLERFNVELLGVRKAELDSKAIRDHDLGDAVVVSVLKKRCLMTADKDLWLWCRNKRLTACYFADGELSET